MSGRVSAYHSDGVFFSLLEGPIIPHPYSYDASYAPSLRVARSNHVLMGSLCTQYHISYPPPTPLSTRDAGSAGSVANPRSEACALSFPEKYDRFMVFIYLLCHKVKEVKKTKL